MTTSELTATAPPPTVQAEPRPTTQMVADTPLLGAPGRVAPFVVAGVALALGAYPLGGEALLAAFVAAVLVLLAAIDIERRIVPNRVVLPAAGLALLGRVALAPGDAGQYALAALLTAVFLFLPRLFKADAMGMGDVKLGLLIGAALGWGAASALALGFLLVFPVALFVALRDGLDAARRTSLPMCPFLALGALVVLLGPGLLGN